MSSDEKATELAWDALESCKARLIIVTKADEVYFLEVLAMLGGKTVSAVTIQGPGKGARINVKGYEPPPPNAQGQPAK